MQLQTVRAVWSWLVLFALLLFAGQALGKTAEQERLQASREVEGYTTDEAGAARAHMAASAARSLALATRFTRYTRMLKGFEEVRVVARDKKAGTMDVYFRFPILKGASHVWVVLRFGKPESMDGGYVVKGTMIKGNIRGFQIKYVVERIDDTNSVLKIEMQVQLYLPVPASVVNREVSGAMVEAVRQLRPHIEAGEK